jgi:4-amino-4-deoxy-L-arabinose transferase-like glycosyltransferase
MRVAAALFLGILATRIPFMTAHLWAWDSGLYARALEEGFYVTADPATQRPHPPGYIWYIGAAALVRGVTHDSNAALVVISMVSGAAGAALLYLIAGRHVRRRVALVAALAYGLSPVVWTYSEVAYPYTLLALLSLALGTMLIEGRRPLLESFALGMLAGFRQDLLVLLGPLWLWRAGALPAWTLALSGVALAAGIMTWLVPTAALSGGAGAYIATLGEQSRTVSGGSLPGGGVDAVAQNLVVLGEPLLVGLNVLWLVLVADALWGVLRAARGHGPRPSRVATGLVLWIAPAVLFYAVVHIGEWGYALFLIPPLVLTAAIRLDRLIPRVGDRAWTALAAALVVVPAILFLATDVRFSARQIRERDRDVDSLAWPCRRIDPGWD